MVLSMLFKIGCTCRGHCQWCYQCWFKVGCFLQRPLPMVLSMLFKVGCTCRGHCQWCYQCCSKQDVPVEVNGNVVWQLTPHTHNHTLQKITYTYQTKTQTQTQTELYFQVSKQSKQSGRQSSWHTMYEEASQYKCKCSFIDVSHPFVDYMTSMLKNSA